MVSLWLLIAENRFRPLNSSRIRSIFLCFCTRARCRVNFGMSFQVFRRSKSRQRGSASGSKPGRLHSSIKSHILPNSTSVGSLHKRPALAALAASIIESLRMFCVYSIHTYVDICIRRPCRIPPMNAYMRISVCIAFGVPITHMHRCEDFYT